MPKPSLPVFSLIVAVLLNGCGTNPDLIATSQKLSDQTTAKDESGNPIPGALAGDEDEDTGDSNGDGRHDRDSDCSLICHRPPGNRGRAHTLWSRGNNVRAHLGHGDTRGRCPRGRGDDDDDDDEDHDD